MKTTITTLLLGTVLGLAPAVWAITPTEAASILFIKQEEKLARDVYQALSAQWDHATFANIAVSEQRHMDAVDGLIRRFGLTDPTPTEPGEFSIPELQALYDDLMVQGSQSLEAALTVGVAVEETDIEDLDALLAVTKDRMIRQVMSNLRQGSRNHLAAFNAALDALAVCPLADPASLGTPAGPQGPLTPAPRAGGRR